MQRTRNGGLVALALACGLAYSGSAHAQFTPPPAAHSGTANSTPAMLSNQYMSPALNPYLNPLAGGAQDPGMARDAAFVYLLSRQAQGGIGSGMMGGARTGSRVATTNRSPAQMTPTAMTPGSGASRYFNSGQGQSNSMNNFYGRKARVVSPVRR